jgi:autotransporter-associated beta strand protein
LGAGTLVLAGANSFDGTLYLDRNGGVNDGITRIVSPNALANVPVTPGSATIVQGNNNAGYSTLQLDGSAGPITLAQEFAVNCRNNANPNIQNLAGNNTLSGNISLNVGGANVYFQSDAGQLIFSGTNQYVGTATAGRTYNFTGAGDHLVSGPILNGANGAPISLAKSGAGTLTLSSDNGYANTTTINEGVLNVTGSINSTGGVYVVGGTLGGTGTINDEVTVQSGGTLAPGTSIGTLTVNGALILAGDLSVEVNKALSPNSDRVVVSGAINSGSGNRVTVRNLGSALAVGDTFTLFSQPLSLGGAMTVVGEGVVWNNNLAVNGTISVASLAIPHPVINSIGVVGTDLVFSGTNGSSGGAFDIVSSTDVLLPLSSWVLETSGTFDGSGNFSVTIPISASVPRKFYSVRLP